MPSREDKLAYLKSLMCEVPQLDQLDPAEIDLLAEVVEFRAVPAGTVLTREGGRGDSLYYVVSGRVEIRKESTDGRQTVLAQYHKGASIGEMSLVDETPRSATAVALEEADLLILRREDFDRIIREHPAIGVKILRNIARSLSTRLRFTSGRFADIFR